MTTEQMDWLDGEGNARGSSVMPILLRASAGRSEYRAAIDAAGNRGVLLIPDEMFDTTERLMIRGVTIVPADEPEPEPTTNYLPVDFPEVIDLDEPVSDHEAEVYAGAFLDPEMRPRLARRRSTADTAQAEEPVEDRLRRAWANGFREGFERGARGDQRWDR